MMTSKYASRPSHSSHPSPSSRSENRTTQTSVKKSTRVQTSDESSPEPSEPVTIKKTTTATSRAETATSRAETATSRAETDEILPTQPAAQPTQRKLPTRRVAARTFEQRFKDYGGMLGDDPEPNELEELKKNARIDVANESGDLSTSAAIVLAKNDRKQLTTRSDRDQAGASNDSGLSPSNPLTEDYSSKTPGPSLHPSGKPQKRLLKRRAQDRDMNRYCPSFDDNATLEPESSVPSPPRPDKRPRLRRDEPSSSAFTSVRSTGINGRIDIQDINNIEGPATAMLRADVEHQKMNKRKHKLDTAGITMSTNDSRKKHRANSPIEIGSDSDEPTSRPRRKRDPKSNTTPKRPKATGTSKPKDKGKPVADDKAERFLVVKTHGKKMTDLELDANREFNKLRISKPVLLTSVPSECRRIGWNEVDMAEEEIREMDQWTKEDMEGAGVQCTFQVDYVSMMRKPVGLNANQSVNEDSGPNFKRFKPKNSRFSSNAPIERPVIPLETIRLKGVADWDSPPKHVPRGRDREKESESDSEEEAVGFFQKPFNTGDSSDSDS